jgi:signal recognition particle subunit SRP54
MKKMMKQVKKMKNKKSLFGKMPFGMWW